MDTGSFDQQKYLSSSEPNGQNYYQNDLEHRFDEIGRGAGKKNGLTVSQASFHKSLIQFGDTEIILKAKYYFIIVFENVLLLANNSFEKI